MMASITDENNLNWTKLISLMPAHVLPGCEDDEIEIQKTYSSVEVTYCGTARDLEA
jgi:hypothetical protein